MPPFQSVLESQNNHISIYKEKPPPNPSPVATSTNYNICTKKNMDHEIIELPSRVRDLPYPTWKKSCKRSSP